MNYRHAYHAGNHADVLKHVVLLALVDALQRKDTPVFVLDTHAGRGEYAARRQLGKRTGEAARRQLPAWSRARPAGARRSRATWTRSRPDDPVGGAGYLPGSP